MYKKPRYRRSYDDYLYYRARRRGGCWYRLKRFVVNTVMTLLFVGAGVLLVGLLYLAYTYQAYLKTVLLVLLGIGGVLVGLALLKLMVMLITTIANAISAMRIRAIAAGKAKVELSKRKLERDAYQQRLKQSQQPRIPAYPQQQSVPVTSSYPEEKLVRRLPLEEPAKSEVPGMPKRTIAYYQEIAHRLQPGQLVALVRADGSLRLEPWGAFKILLVLGGSSSGKSTTIAEKVLGFVNGGGLIVPCDPHDTKEDSLFKKISPLAPALYPGAVFAVDHAAILQNMRLVTAILEDRVQNGDSSIPVLLVVEELNRLLRDKAIAKEISLILETLGEEGRGYNVFVLVGCQRVTYLSDIRKAFISFIVHRSDESEAQLLIPHRYAKYCPELRPGQCFVKDSNGVTEGGLQVFVTRQDIEQASMRLSQWSARMSVDRHPTMRLDQDHPHRRAGSMPARLHPTRSIDPRRHDPVSSPRIVHKTRLQPLQGEPERPVQPIQQNPLHTWSLPQEAREEAREENPPFHTGTGPARTRDTEELSPNDLSISQQFAILALMRKKKHPQEKE